MEMELNEIETRYLRTTTGLLLTMFAFAAFASTEELTTDEALAPESRHENIGELVTTFIQKSHYNHIAVDDDLSSKVMDTYINELDRNRVYLFASDIEFFEQYR